MVAADLRSRRVVTQERLIQLWASFRCRGEITSAGWPGVCRGGGGSLLDHELIEQGVDTGEGGWISSHGGHLCREALGV
jgi:hypothetical protein